ncbi:MAG: oxidoreductase, partial [Halobacteriota archaeon]
MSEWSPANIPDRSGRMAIVTGANSGLGFEATNELARAGMHVVMAGRDIDRVENAREEIRAEIDGASLIVGELDLASLDSVRSFTETITSELDSLDLLCNNAGVMAIPRTETDDGFETQFGVNHLGHFALTGQLLDALASAPDPRVVTHSSGLHTRGRMVFDDLHGESDYDKWDAYAQSKLANLLFAYELDRRYGDVLTSVACHPGWAATNLQRRGPERMGSRLRVVAMDVANRLFAQS